MAWGKITGGPCHDDDLDDEAAQTNKVDGGGGERAEWLSLFEKSGQAAAQFCRDNDLSTSTLSYWLRRHHQTLTSSEEALIELPREVVSAATGADSPSGRGTAAGVTMQLPGGLRLEIVAGTDPVWLGQVLRMLPAGRP